MKKMIYLLFFIISFFVSGCTGGDTEIPDTKRNQNIYSGFFSGQPGKDVTGIYIFYDMTWPDPVYCLAFTAPPSIIAEIITEYGLKEETNSDYLEPYNEHFNKFHWWSADERKESRYYGQIDDKKRIGYQLWYHEEKQKCQVLIIYM